MKATPKEWPGTAEEHAADLQRWETEEKERKGNIPPPSTAEDHALILAKHEDQSQELEKYVASVASNLAISGGTNPGVFPPPLIPGSDEAAGISPAAIAFAHQNPESVPAAAIHIIREAAGPCPGGRTASPEYLIWATRALDDEAFAKLYRERAHELTDRFRDRPDLAATITRLSSLITDH